VLGYFKRRALDRVIPGYSDGKHWRFFHRLLKSGNIRFIAIMGVYQGRDIAYMVRALESGGVKDFHITGFDRFADVAGEDWPAEKKGMTWEEAGFGPAPTLENARSKLQNAGMFSNVTLIKGDADEILVTDEKFDFIYIDISHDYESTIHAIDLAIAKAKPSTIIGGDDFSDQDTWGVKRGVEAKFKRYELSEGWIWSATMSDLKE